MYEIYKVENLAVLANPGTFYFRPTKCIAFKT